MSGAPESSNVVAFPLRTKEEPELDPRSEWMRVEMRRMLRDEALHVEEARAAYDEDEFFRRFRARWPRRDREALLDYQRKVSISDHHIRWLTRSNSLRCKDGSVSISGEGWFAAYGWSVIVCFWLMLGVPLCVGAYRAKDGVATAAIWFAGICSIYALSHGVWHFYVLPWVLARRVRRQLASSTRSHTP